MRVHATRHPPRRIYSCHGHPFSSLSLKGWHTPPNRCGGGVIVLGQQGDPPHQRPAGASCPTQLPVDACCSKTGRLAVNRLPSQTRNLGKADRSRRHQHTWWIPHDQPPLHTPCRLVTASGCPPTSSRGKQRGLEEVFRHRQVAGETVDVPKLRAGRSRRRAPIPGAHTPCAYYMSFRDSPANYPAPMPANCRSVGVASTHPPNG